MVPYSGVGGSDGASDVCGGLRNALECSRMLRKLKKRGEVCVEGPTLCSWCSECCPLNTHVAAAPAGALSCPPDQGCLPGVGTQSYLLECPGSAVANRWSAHHWWSARSERSVTAVLGHTVQPLRTRSGKPRPRKGHLPCGERPGSILAKRSELSEGGSYFPSITGNASFSRGC